MDNWDSDIISTIWFVKIVFSNPNWEGLENWVDVFSSNHTDIFFMGNFLLKIKYMEIV